MIMARVGTEKDVVFLMEMKECHYKAMNNARIHNDGEGRKREREVKRHSMAVG